MRGFAAQPLTYLIGRSQPAIPTSPQRRWGERLEWFLQGLGAGCKELFDVLGNLRYTVAVYFINRSNEGRHDVHRF